METVNIFWTAGLDSSFRVVELASAPGFVIQPWYITDPGRRSTPIEERRIREMTALIRRNPATQSELRDVRVVALQDIAIDPGIQASFDRINARQHVGKQYLWLASFLHGRDLFAEVSSEAPHERIGAAIQGECTLIPLGVDVDRTLAADPAASTEDGLRLFGRMLFPAHQWELTKADEMRLMQEWGYGDVFDRTWFCHRPILGMPCGHCDPCRSAREEGFGWRIPTPSRFLYPFVRPIQKRLKKK